MRAYEVQRADGTPLVRFDSADLADRSKRALDDYQSSYGPHRVVPVEVAATVAKAGRS